MNNNNFTDFYNNFDTFNELMKFNQGKSIKIYTNIDNNKVFEGIVEQAGHDYIIISNPESEKWDLIFIKNINYINFLEKINKNNTFYS